MNNSIHIIGNAHLDPIWLWRWQEGCGEVLQTFRSAVDRLNEYDGFIFTCSSASYYKWVEEIDPELFAEITKLVKKGRWVPVNGWWVQPDCNMPAQRASPVRRSTASFITMRNSARSARSATMSIRSVTMP